MKNQQIIDRFFEAFMKHDMDGVRKVMHEDVVWTFNGQHPLAGEKKGIEDLVWFFGQMNAIMQESKPTVDKIIVASEGNYTIECQHIRTNRADGNNIDHHACVLWTFKDGKIISGRHFFADPQAVDRYFTAVTEIKPY